MSLLSRDMSEADLYYDFTSEITGVLDHIMLVFSHISALSTVLGKGGLRG